MDTNLSKLQPIALRTNSYKPTPELSHVLKRVTRTAGLLRGDRVAADVYSQFENDLETLMAQLGSEAQKVKELMAQDGADSKLNESESVLALSYDSLREILQDALRKPIGLLAAVNEMKNYQQLLSQNIQNRLDMLSAKLDSMHANCAELSAIRAILESLHFQEMPMRRIQIPVAYAKTNAWMLEPGTSPFRNWLESTSSTEVFWLSGKAGSGKSTLVKFLADNSVTRRIVEEWAGLPSSASKAENAKRVAIVGYYFWRSGYPMQKSLNGLFQSMLYNILKQ
jgi:hypothetical protein